ncbi:dihydrodipicolinate synthase family protein [Paraburkholderia sp. J12]|uniref:dihydrodipicolinate synthase family protein n=1 Tax=Paraburkholderia sp. J12 TaxID=2805432 RepID=UPI002ABD2B99|nr:dihydrodipicolinate synthase family protein [Paraburkholderia sp. J12]
MSTTKFKGIIAYPITPFSRETGGVDVSSLRRSIERLIADGVHAIAPLGSTGECAYLTDDEWDEVAECATKTVSGRVPVVVGISDLTTHNAIRRAVFAERAGADAVMVLPVSYWKLTEAEIRGHYAAIAKAINIPIMVYNNPATSGIDMSPRFIADLVRDIDNVTMVKESSGDVQRMHELRQLSDGAIPFYNGCNPIALEALAAGASGWCTAAPNLIPELNLHLYHAVAAGQMDIAREVFYRQLPMLKFILSLGLPATIKAGLRLQGFDVGAPRKPLQELTGEAIVELGRLLDQVRNQ